MKYLSNLVKETGIPFEYFKNIYDKGYKVSDWKIKNLMDEGLDLNKIQLDTKIKKSINYLADKLSIKPYSLKILFLKGYLVSKNKEEDSNNKGLENALSLEEKRKRFAINLNENLEEKFMLEWVNIE